MSPWLTVSSRKPFSSKEKVGWGHDCHISHCPYGWSLHREESFRIRQNRDVDQVLDSLYTSMRTHKHNPRRDLTSALNALEGWPLLFLRKADGDIPSSDRRYCWGQKACLICGNCSTEQMTVWSEARGKWDCKLQGGSGNEPPWQPCGTCPNSLTAVEKQGNMECLENMSNLN